MDFEKLLATRRSIRAFDTKPIPEEFLDKILEAARMSPTAGNVQAFRMKIVRSQAVKEKLVPACLNQAFIADAPVIIIFSACPAESKEHYKERGEKLYAVQDATIALYSAHLMAAELGLGSCWIGAFNENQVRGAAKISNEYIPVGLLPVGYAKESPDQRPRKAVWKLIIE
jgi:nitroreductase